MHLTVARRGRWSGYDRLFRCCSHANLALLVDLLATILHSVATHTDIPVIVQVDFDGVIRCPALPDVGHGESQDLSATKPRRILRGNRGAARGGRGRTGRAGAGGAGAKGLEERKETGGGRKDLAGVSERRAGKYYSNSVWLLSHRVNSTNGRRFPTFTPHHMTSFSFLRGWSDEAPANLNTLMTIRMIGTPQQEDR